MKKQWLILYQLSTNKRQSTKKNCPSELSEFKKKRFFCTRQQQAALAFWKENTKGKNCLNLLNSLIKLLILFKTNKMNRNITCIYHGCFRKNEDGTNRIIANNEACLFSRHRQFWKYPEDIPAGVKTRSQYKQKNLVKTFDRYIWQIF